MLSEYEAYAHARGIKSPNRESVLSSEYRAYVRGDERTRCESFSRSMMKLLAVLTAALGLGWLVGGGGWVAEDSHAPQIERAA